MCDGCIVVPLGHFDELSCRCDMLPVYWWPIPVYYIYLSMVFVSSFSLPRESNFSSYLFLISVFNICVQNLFKNGEIGSMECTARIKTGRKCYHVVCCKNGELFLSKFLLLRSIASNCLNWRWYSIDARSACYKVVQRFPLYVTVPWDILGLPATWQDCGTSLKIRIRRLSAVNKTAAHKYHRLPNLPLCHPYRYF